MPRDDARKHIRARHRLGIITGGLDALVVEKFLALDDLRRGSLLLTYQKLFGPKRAAWVAVALPRWRKHPDTISGMVAARLLYVLPTFLTAEESATLLEKWQDSWRLSHVLPETGTAGRVQLLRVCEGNQKMADEILLAVGQRRLCKLPGSVPLVILPPPPPSPPAPAPPLPEPLPLRVEPVERIAPRVVPPEPKPAPPTTSSAPSQPTQKKPAPSNGCTGIFIALLAGFVALVWISLASSPVAPVGSIAPSPVSPTASPAFSPSLQVETWNAARLRAIAQYPDVANPDSPLGRAVRQELDDLKKADSAELQSPDAPLAITKRVAERLAQPAAPWAVEINFVQKQNRLDPHSRIEAVGGYNRDGTVWRLSLLDAVAGVQAGKYAFYVAQGGSRVRVIVSTSRDGNSYLKTEADGKSANNLLSLPSFP